MSLLRFDELHAATDAARPRLPVAAAGAADATVLTALAEAGARGWVEPILVGSAEAILATAAAARVDIAGFRVVNAPDPVLPAVAEVREGRARLLMKGQVDTPTLVRAVLN